MIYCYDKATWMKEYAMLYTAPNATRTNEAVLERQERRRNEEFCSCFCFLVLFRSGLILYF